MGNEIQLGQKVKDTVTGFEGIATVVADHLYGCQRIGVTPKASEAGDHREVEFFDAPRLEVLSDGIREKWMSRTASKQTAPGPETDPTRDRSQ